MGTTRSTLRSRVTDIVGRTDKNDVINLAMQLALDEIGLRFDPRQSRQWQDYSLSTAQETLALPDSTLHVINVTLIDSTNVWSRDVVILDQEIFENYFPNTAADPTGKPTHCWLSKGPDAATLHFHPRSDGSYTIRTTRVKLLGSDFSSDTAQQPYDGFDNAVVQYAAAYLYASVENFQAAKEWQVRFEQSAGNFLRSDRRRPGTKRIMQGWGGTPIAVFPHEYWNDPLVSRMP